MKGFVALLSAIVGASSVGANSVAAEWGKDGSHYISACVGELSARGSNNVDQGKLIDAWSEVVLGYFLSDEYVQVNFKPNPDRFPTPPVPMPWDPPFITCIIDSKLEVCRLHAAEPTNRGWEMREFVDESCGEYEARFDKVFESGKKGSLLGYEQYYLITEEGYEWQSTEETESPVE